MVDYKDESLSPMESVKADHSKGLARTTVAGPGRSMREVYQNLKSSPKVQYSLEHPGRVLMGARVGLDKDEGEGYWEFFHLDNDIYLNVCNFSYIDLRREQVPGEGLLEFHIKLSGHFTLETARAEHIEVEGPSLLIWNQPEGIDVGEWVPPGNQEASVSIFCEPSFITEHFSTDIERLPDNLRKIINYDANNSINYCQVPLSSELIQAASTLVKCKLTGIPWLIHAEAKAIELLCHIVSAFKKLQSPPDRSYKERDLELFREARKIITSQFNPPPTISEIASRVGINETKLKHGFKDVYGTTIFECGHKFRMKYAMELLCDKRVRVGQVAEEIGYRHQSTFAKAFRDFFGIRPNDARKTVKT